MPAALDESIEQRMQTYKNMLHEIPWIILSKFLALKSVAYDEFQRGGFRLDERNKSKMVDLIASAYEDGDGEHLFLKWLNTKRNYLDIIEPFYRDYSEWAKNHGVKEGKYVMQNDLFARFATSLERNHALVFLHFSPIAFTAEQKTVLIRISTLKEGQRKEPEILHVGGRRFAFVEQDELQQLKAENQRMRQQLERHARGGEDALRIAKKIEKEYTEKLDGALMEKHRLDAEIEKQAGVIRRFERTLSHREGEIKNLTKRFSGLEEKEKKQFHTILSKIDFQELVKSLNEPDEVKVLLDSLVKAPSSEEAVVDKTGNDFKTFFEGLSRNESAILKVITSISITSIADGSYFQKWADHADELLDLKYNYRAKAVIVNLIYETLRQCYSAEK